MVVQQWRTICCTNLEKLFSREFCFLHYQEVDNKSKARKNSLFTQKKKEKG
jgi:hypothetical protein